MGRWLSQRASGLCLLPLQLERYVFQNEVVMTERSQQCRVVAGPSREELFDALRLRHEDRRLHFTLGSDGRELGLNQRLSIDKDRRIVVLVNSIGIEDGSGNRWLLRVILIGLGSIYLTGYFDTATRTGYLQPEVQ
jgi:hypothetical protein